jgi:hypothetical protein
MATRSQGRWPARVDGRRAQEITTVLPRNAGYPARVTAKQANAPAAGGLATGASAPPMARSSALEGALGSLQPLHRPGDLPCFHRRRHSQTGGQRLPRLSLTPLGWLRAHGYPVDSPARSRPRPSARAKEQAAPVPGGHDGSRPHSSWTGNQIERLPHYSHYIGSRRGSRLPRPSWPPATNAPLAACASGRQGAQGWKGWGVTRHGWARRGGHARGAAGCLGRPGPASPMP